MLRLTALAPLRALRRPPPVRMFAQDGQIEVRLTRRPTDIRAAQRLRYRVFYEEMAAKPTPAMARQRRDFDSYDKLCDHVVVYDHARPRGQRVVGTYRMLRREVAVRHGGFYTAREFDIAPLLARAVTDGEIMEVGRSCVAAAYRNSATIQLLWRGIASYMITHNIRLAIGCASLPGTDPSAHARALSYLYHHHMAPKALRVRALTAVYRPMNLMAKEAIAPRTAVRDLPPLIKAYLRLGAYVGDGAYIDQQFGTVDVFMVLPLERVAMKYHQHFEREEDLSTARVLRRRLLRRVLPIIRRVRRSAAAP